MRLSGFRRRNEGTTAIEFALVSPIFVSLMLAVLQVGLVVWTQLALEHAVESAVRCAAINSSTCGDASHVQTYAATQAYGLSLPASTFSYSTNPSPNSCGFLVTASYLYYFFSEDFAVGSTTLTAKACFPN